MDLRIHQPYQTRQSYTGGRCKAVFIGINYKGSSAALRGCVNDVRMMLETLRNAEFPITECCILVDEANFPGTAGTPTKANIIRAMQWLSYGARPGDTLFIHYSGHGSQKRNLDGTEEDGFDETMIPVDYQRAGMILDDDIYKLLVSPLPAGVRLTAVMDCCHSGTLMDLPYEFESDASGQVVQKSWGFGKKKKKKKKKKKGKKYQQHGGHYGGGGLGGVMHALLGREGEPQQQQGGYGPPGQPGAAGQFRRTNANYSEADVILFSGCSDAQTSADVANMSSFQTPASHPGQSGGACTGALSEVLSGTSGLSIVKLLTLMRQSLERRRFTQRPQLSSSKPVDMNKPFSFFGSLALAQPGHYAQQQGGPYQQAGGYPQGTGYPPQQTSGYPPQQPGYPQQTGGYPPQQPGYPPQQSGYPPQQSGYPQQQPGYPPQQQAGMYPTGGYPPPQQQPGGPFGGFQQQQGGGYPPQQQPGGYRDLPTTEEQPQEENESNQYLAPGL